MVTIGIGQDKMQETPLQIANSMCIVANKGFYYTPHFVRDIEGSPEDDTLLGRFHLSPEGCGQRMRYQTLRSVSDNHVFVICRDDRFYDLVAEEVRKRGPWQGNRRGEVINLKPEYRLALARDGYALLAVFKPEA